MFNNLNCQTSKLLGQLLNASNSASMAMMSLVQEVNNVTNVLGNPKNHPRVSMHGNDLLRVDLEYDLDLVDDGVLTYTLAIVAEYDSYQVDKRVAVAGDNVPERLRSRVESSGLHDLKPFLRGRGRCTQY